MATIPRDQRLLRRSRSARILGGVCGGLGYYFSVDPWLVRLLFIVFAITAGAGLVVYVLLWVFMPAEGTDERPRKGQ